MKAREFLQHISSSVTSTEAASILNTTSTKTAKILNRWTAQGWLNRVGHGLYIPTPILNTEKGGDDDNLAIVHAIIGEEGYVCGFSALEYWGITEQIFINLSLASFKWKRFKKVILSNKECFIYNIPEDFFIGVEPLWHHNKKIFVSDIHKTIVDILLNPKWGGGLLHVVDCFRNYWNNDSKDISKIFYYAHIMKVTGIFYKRLGYILEIVGHTGSEIEFCQNQITSRYSPLDPNTKTGTLCKKWKLIIPKNLKI